MECDTVGRMGDRPHPTIRLGPSPHEIGPTRLGVWMDKVGLNGLSCALGIGRHSDRQLTQWACEREQYARRCAKELLYIIASSDRREAQELSRKWPGVFG
jgi:hypothetical protein